MDLTIRTVRPYKKKLTIRATILLIFLYSCVHYDKCSEWERKIESTCVETDSIYSITFNFFEGVAWEYLYIVSGPRFEGEVSEIIGTPYDKIVQDDSKIFIFLRDGRIVQEFSSSCRKVRLNRIFEDGSAKIQYSDIINVRKCQNEGGVYFETISISGDPNF